jgi:hypothetical protein
MSKDANYFFMRNFLIGVSQRLQTFNISIQQSNVQRQIHLKWQDTAIVLILAIIGGLASFSGAQLVEPLIVNEKANNIWFEADVARVFDNMTNRGSNHYRTKVHPLFSIVALPPVYLLEKILSLDTLTSVRTVIAVVAAIWLAVLFIVLRLIGCRRFDAILFSLLGAASAAAMFWFTVPETYSFGSLSILLGLLLAVIGQYRQLSSFWYIIVSTLTLGMTTTNWMVGILATMVNHRRKRALQISVNSFCLAIVLWSIQKFIFPSAEFFIGDLEEKRYILKPESGGPLRVFTSFVYHTMVMPSIEVVSDFTQSDRLIMVTQLSSAGSGSLWGAVAVGSWLALLTLGLWALFFLKKNGKVRLVIGLALLGQLALHIVYGNETFLYSLHFVPLLIVLAALSTLTQARVLGLVLAGILLLTTAINNGLQFQQATQDIFRYSSPHVLVQVPIKQ